MAKAAPPAVPSQKPTSATAAKKACERWLELSEKRDRLSCEDDALKREQDLCLATAARFLGDDDEAKLPGGWRIFAQMKRSAVAWKNEVIRVLGAEHVAKMQENAPTKRVVLIEKAA